MAREIVSGLAALVGTVVLFAAWAFARGAWNGTARRRRMVGGALVLAAIALTVACVVAGGGTGGEVSELDPW